MARRSVARRGVRLFLCALTSCGVAKVRGGGLQPRLNRLRTGSSAVVAAYPYNALMPREENLQTVRRILETDRTWAAYALADLTPEHRDYCEWRCAADGAPALLLVYRAFDVPVLVAVGPAEQTRPLLAEVAAESRFYLSARPDFLPALRDAGYEVRNEKAMWRMVLPPGRFQPPNPFEASMGQKISGGTRLERLGPADHAALRELYADGAATGETPEFFTAAMLETGAYYGARENGALIAAAGTHVLAPSESVAAIGNVYTRRDRRGRGWAGRVTAAVAADLLRRGLRTIVLNVARGNAAAIRAYQRLGFAHAYDFCEGLAFGNTAR